MEVEALEGDSELNLVTEVWVEPQYGRIGPGPESWKHLQDLTYSEIPQAVSDPRTVLYLLPDYTLLGGCSYAFLGTRGGKLGRMTLSSGVSLLAPPTGCCLHRFPADL